MDVQSVETNQVLIFFFYLFNKIGTTLEFMIEIFMSRLLPELRHDFQKMSDKMQEILD